MRIERINVCMCVSDMRQTTILVYLRETNSTMAGISRIRFVSAVGAQRPRSKHLSSVAQLFFL